MSRASIAADRLLARLHVTSPADLREIDDVAWAAKALVVEATLEGAEGRHLRRAGRSIVSVRDGLYPPRRRFTVAHELGHLEMHREVSDLLVCLEGDVSESPQVSRGPRNVEGEANEFAGCFLMPAMMLRPILRGNPPSFDLIDEIVATFDVSLTAALERFTATTVESCALVHSRNGIVQRFTASRDFREAGLFVPVRTPVDRDTYAHSAFNGEHVPRRGEQVDASSWLSPGGYRDDALVREFTWPMPRFDAALSLIWIDEDIEPD